MKLYYPITVDLYKPYPIPIMEAQQNNIGRGALVTLTAQGAVITPTGESIQLYAKKPDGTISYLACTLIGSQIQCDFTNQMLALPGMVQVELQMIGGASGSETEITTPIFAVKVNPSNVDDSAIESQDEFPALVTALAEVEDLKKNGLKGDAATVTVGSTTTGDPGTDAAVSNSGTTGDAVLNFTIPRGADGSMWYYGDAITGNSTSGTVFAESGITSANMGDKYLNTSSGADKGNVYTCTVAGDAETAQWVYIGNIEGPQGPEGPAGMQEITFAARSAFPESGQENMLYIDNTLSPAVLYLFNTGLNHYVPINQGSVEFTGSGTTILMQSQQVPKSFRSLKIYGKSTQNGTPSPESPAPIETAGSDGAVNVNLTGANLLFGIYNGFLSNADGSITSTSEKIKVTDFIPICVCGNIYTYIYNYASNNPLNYVYRIGFYKSDKSWIKNIPFDTADKKTVEIPAGSYYVRFSYIKNTKAMASFFDFNSYSEPNNETFPMSTPNGLPGIPVESGGNYTDESGQQWIADVKDYGTGKYTQNIGQIASYNGEGVGDVWMSSTGQLTTGANVIYQLATPIVTDLPAEEIEAYKALKTYTPTTVISSDSGVWLEADLVDSDILYPHAENTSYDNSTSGLTADNVQAAIDENAEAISALNSRIDSRIIQTEIFNGTVACEAYIQKMVTGYTIPEGYTLMCFDIQVSGTTSVSKMISFYHTSTNIYMCADVAQNYKVKILATYLKS